MNISLFDLDNTLLPIDSDEAWGNFMARSGAVDAEDFARRNNGFYRQYLTGTLDVREYVRFVCEGLRSCGREGSEKLRAQFMQEIIAPAIRPQALKLLDECRRAGDAVAIVTATNEFVTAPIAAALGVEELIATRLARGADGWVTGEIEGVASFREGKITRVTDWLTARGLDWNTAHITFYSDSINDLPLLEKAHQPVATNPDTRLRTIAEERGWRILNLFTAP